MKSEKRIEEESDGAIKASHRDFGWRALICLAHDAKNSHLDL